MSNNEDSDKKKLRLMTILAIVLLCIGLVLYVLNPSTVIQFNVIDLPYDLFTLEN